MRRLLLLFSVILLLGLIACVQSQPETAPVETVAIEMEAPMTVTPLPSWTPSKTAAPATATPLPSDTPIPATPTVEPTATVVSATDEPEQADSGAADVMTDTTTASTDTVTDTAKSEDDPPPPTEPFLLFFYADWCGHCSKMKPIVGELYEEYSEQVFFVAFNIDDEESKAYSAQFEVRGVPTFVFMTNAGTVIEKYAGERPKGDLVKSIETLIEKDAEEKAAE